MRNSLPQFTLGVSAVDRRERIEIFLVRQFRNYTLFRMQRMIASGAVEIRNRPAMVGERVRIGDEVVVRLIEPPDKLYEPEELPLEITYEDPWLIVLDEPAGMVCHPVSADQTGTICNALQAHFDRQTQFPGILRPGIVHRLDRQTSGLLVVGKTHLSHRGLVEQFENSEVRKEYLAVVEGVVEKDSGEIVRPIGRSTRNRILASVDSSARRKKLARTDFFVEERYTEHSLVRAVLWTGRMHQIRVHFASIGHPVVGDFFYGGTVSNEYGSDLYPSNVMEAYSKKRHMLHACSLQFRHPVLHRAMAFRLPIPPDMQESLDAVKNAVVCLT